MDILDKLRKAGYRVRAEGDKVKATWQGEGKPDPDTVRPLIAELKAHKGAILEALREEAGEMPECDPFDPDWPPAGWIVTLPDRDRPGWLARRAGTLEPCGRGADQVEAILSLAAIEEAR